MKKEAGKTKRMSAKKGSETLADPLETSPGWDKIREENKGTILKARAQVLAAEEEEESPQTDSVEILEFSLAYENYGIETGWVGEVVPLKKYTVLPGVPDFVFGIFNVRGQILSIIDLKKFFHLPEKGLGELNKVIIIHTRGMEFGILADVIHGTRLVSLDNLQKSLPNLSKIGTEYIMGITTEPLIVLNAERILKDEHIIVNQEIL